LATFIKDFAPATNIIIHRDRDFMTDSEIQRAIQKLAGCGAAVFLTEGSDIESYFVTPEHIAAVTALQPVDATEWLVEIAKASRQNKLTILSVSDLISHARSSSSRAGRSEVSFTVAVNG
jgi:hypothetical protein